MTDRQYHLAATEAANYIDIGAYCSDLLTSSAFAPEDETADLDLAPIPELRRIWKAVNLPFRDLLRELGLSQTACARRFCIPLRTIQNWARNIARCPVYTRLMISEIMSK